MSTDKHKKTGLVDEATLRAFARGELDERVEDEIVALLEKRPELQARVAAISVDPVIEKMREHSQVAARPSLSSQLEQEKNRANAQEPVVPPTDIPQELEALSEFRVIKELGRGGMGVVYLAENKWMRRKEVLKVLNERLLDNKDAKSRFRKEIQITAQLDHPAIVKSHSVRPLKSVTVFSMEYVKGKNLHEFIATNGKLPIHLACSIVLDVCGGLQHAMNKGAIHRDIKPSNIMLFKSDDGQIRAKILDFGLARVASSDKKKGLTEDGTLLGTLEYIAPEQSLDANKADIRADIYSLGCTLYHMLVGHPPFSGTTGELILAHSQTLPPSPHLIQPSVPVELANIVSRMLAKQPARRYQTPAQAAAALKPFATKQSPKLIPETPAEPHVTPKTIGAEAEALHDTSVEIARQSVANPPVDSSLTEAARECDSVAIPPINTEAYDRRHRKKGKSISKLLSPTYWLVGAAMLAGVVALALAALEIRTPNGTLVIGNLPADAKVLIDGDVVQLRWEGKTARVQAIPGERTVEVMLDDTIVQGEMVKVASGADSSLTIMSKTNLQSQTALKDQETNSASLTLFDGSSLEMWRGLKSEQISPSWEILDGGLFYGGTGGDHICTKETYGDFDLFFEWRVASGGNSGVFYCATAGESILAKNTPEYAIVDSKNDEAKNDSRRYAGAMYGLFANNLANAKDAGEWNTARIRRSGNTIQHWLNGALVVAEEVGSSKWNETISRSRPSLTPSFGKKNRGHIVLQAHKLNNVWYRNIEIKDLSKVTISDERVYAFSKPEQTESSLPFEVLVKGTSDGVPIGDLRIGQEFEVRYMRGEWGSGRRTSSPDKEGERGDFLTLLIGPAGIVTTLPPNTSKSAFTYTVAQDGLYKLRMADKLRGDNRGEVTYTIRIRESSGTDTPSTSVQPSIDGEAVRTLSLFGRIDLQPELLANPGNEEASAENPAPGWSVERGRWEYSADSAYQPRRGKSYFKPQAVKLATLSQIVSLDKYKESIDNEALYVRVKGYVRTDLHSNADGASIVLEYLDREGESLAKFESEQYVQQRHWQEIADVKIAPPGTRMLKLTLIARRLGGVANQGFFDDLSIKVLEEKHQSVSTHTGEEYPPQVGLPRNKTSLNDITIKDITIKDLPRHEHSNSTWQSLFDGKTLSGWTRRQGTAMFSVEGGEIVGRTNQSFANSFLCTRQIFSDFELAFETKITQGNSGVQIRSLSIPEYKKGRIHGPQIEIERAPGSSGYLYSEGTGRHWLTKEQPIQDAFNNDGWNRYLIRADGDRIQTWINGRPIIDIRDSESSQSGFIALQVHSRKKEKGPFEMRWRDIRIRDLNFQ